MKLIKNPSRSVWSPFWMEGLWGSEPFGGPCERAYEEQRVPVAQVKARDTHFDLRLATPGLRKTDIQVHVDDDVLTISSEKKPEEKKEEQEDDHRETFGHYSFKRSFQLPKGLVDASRIHAQYTDGVLHVHIPKTKEKQTLRKQIAVE